MVQRWKAMSPEGTVETACTFSRPFGTRITAGTGSQRCNVGQLSDVPPGQEPDAIAGRQILTPFDEGVRAFLIRPRFRLACRLFYLVKSKEFDMLSPCRARTFLPQPRRWNQQGRLQQKMASAASNRWRRGCARGTL